MERLKHIIQINFVLGAWLIAAPFVLGYPDSRLQMGNDVILGLLLALCSWWMLAFSRGHAVAGGLQLLAGLWLITGPFAWHDTPRSRPFSNDIVVGVISFAASATATWMFNSRARKPA